MSLEYAGSSGNITAKSGNSCFKAYEYADSISNKASVIPMKLVTGLTDKYLDSDEFVEVCKNTRFSVEMTLDIDAILAMPS